MGIQGSYVFYCDHCGLLGALCEQSMEGLDSAYFKLVHIGWHITLGSDAGPRGPARVYCTDCAEHCPCEEKPEPKRDDSVDALGYLAECIKAKKKRPYKPPTVTTVSAPKAPKGEN